MKRSYPLLLMGIYCCTVCEESGRLGSLKCTATGSCWPWVQQVFFPHIIYVYPLQPLKDAYLGNGWMFKSLRRSQILSQTSNVRHFVELQSKQHFILLSISRHCVSLPVPGVQRPSDLEWRWQFRELSFGFGGQR